MNKFLLVVFVLIGLLTTGAGAAEQVEMFGHHETADGRCEDGYSHRIKICWGGWRRGFYRCGTVCSPDERTCDRTDQSEYCRWKNGNH